MKSHPIGMRTVYELFDKKGGNIIYSSSNQGRMQEMKAEIEVKINKPGQPERILNFPFRSFTSNFARILQYKFLRVMNDAGAETINKIIETTTGGATTLTDDGFTMDVAEIALTGSAQTAYGIQIGDINDLSSLSTTAEAGIGGAVAYGDYSLHRLMLADGGSPDTDVTYYATNITMPTDNKLVVTRRFTNTSASDYYITEIGLVGKVATAEYALIARDIVDDGTNAYFSFEAGATVQVSYLFEVTDASGLTQNFVKMLSSDFTGTSCVSQAKDINNVAYTVDFSTAQNQTDMLAAATDATFGVQVGYDAKADANQFRTSATKVQGVIAHGTILNTLYYEVVTPITMTQSDMITTFGLYRDFENKYALASVNVNNSGLVISEAAASKFYLLAIDGPLTTIVVAPNQVLRIRYYFDSPV